MKKCLRIWFFYLSRRWSSWVQVADLHWFILLKIKLKQIFRFSLFLFCSISHWDSIDFLTKGPFDKWCFLLLEAEDEGVFSINDVGSWLVDVGVSVRELGVRCTRKTSLQITLNFALSASRARFLSLGNDLDTKTTTWCCRIEILGILLLI